MQIKKIISNLGFLIIVATAAGIVAGILLGEDAQIFAPLGELFILLIKMLVIPLVAVSVISGAASLGGTRSAGKLGIATFVYYLATTAIAVSIGLIFGELFKPGSGLDITTVEHMFSQAEAVEGGTPGFWETIFGIIPENPFSSFVEGNILQVLFFCLFLGFGIASLSSEKKDFMLNIFNGLTEALIWMVKIVMYTAPIGVFGLMASAVGTFGYEILELVLKLLFIYIAAIVTHGLFVYTGILKVFTQMPLKKFFSKMYKPQLVALSTASSMATLPVNFEVCEEELGVSKETASFVLPLGATINMDGNAIYYALAAIFFAQLFGIDLSATQYAAIILTATVGSIGQAGVPGPTLLVVAVLLAANIPIIGLPLLYAVDRIFDMIRTSLNITGDAVCAIVVDKLNYKTDENL